MRIVYDHLRLAEPENLARLARSLGLHVRPTDTHQQLVDAVYGALEQDHSDALAEQFRELKRWMQERQ